MNKRGKVMLIATIIITVALVIKSVWIDPVRGLEGDYLKYKSYALQAAPQDPGLFVLAPSPVVKYQVISVKKTSQEGDTIIKYQDSRGVEIEERLKGQYEAKVRGYILSLLPFTDIKVKGGQHNGD